MAQMTSQLSRVAALCENGSIVANILHISNRVSKVHVYCLRRMLTMVYFEEGCNTLGEGGGGGRELYSSYKYIPVYFILNMQFWRPMSASLIASFVRNEVEQKLIIGQSDGLIWCDISTFRYCMFRYFCTNLSTSKYMLYWFMLYDFFHCTASKYSGGSYYG